LEAAASMAAGLAGAEAFTAAGLAAGAFTAGVAGFADDGAALGPPFSGQD
jgi:hypothetical protein